MKAKTVFILIVKWQATVFIKYKMPFNFKDNFTGIK